MKCVHVEVFTPTDLHVDIGIFSLVRIFAKP
jgi:hypothetical protein